MSYETIANNVIERALICSADCTLRLDDPLRSAGR